MLAQIDLTGVVTMDLLCQAIAHWRQRPIRLLPLPMPPGLTGMWMPEDTEDLIAYDRYAPPLLAEQAIAHELGHLLSGHQAHGHVLSPTLLALFAHLAPERVQHALRHALGRMTYESDDEFVAEYFGSLVEQLLETLRIDADGVSEADHAARARLMWWTRSLREPF